MGYFPLCINLSNASVILIGEGRITRDKLKILLSFGANIRLFSLDGFEDVKQHPQVFLERRTLLSDDLIPRPTLMVVGDVNEKEKMRLLRPI